VPASSLATLSNAGAVNTTFVADVPGTYVAQLIVNDGHNNSDRNSVHYDELDSAAISDAGRTRPYARRDLSIERQRDGPAEFDDPYQCR